MENPKEVEINADDVFACPDSLKMRRVIAVFNGMVVYSKGGDKNGACSIDTFRKWLSGPKVECIYKAKEKFCA